MDDDAPPGVPEWVVTYGDMMSLLLTFFIMLVSLSEVVADQRYRAILASLQHYVGYSSGPIAPPGKNFPLNSLVEQLTLPQLGSFITDDKIDGTGGVKKQSVEGDELRVYRTREGLPVQAGPTIIFSQFQDKLPDDASEALQQIVKGLAGKPNKVDIRCHCGPADPPPNSGVPDKFSLTYERGRAVLEYLVRAGIGRERLRVTAVGDSEPLLRTGDRKSQELDRVEVFVLDAYTDDFVGPREIPN